MPPQLRGLLDRNVITGLAVGLVALVVLISFAAAVTGHYDSASVRAWIDDLKLVAGLLAAGVGVGRGVMAAGQRVADGHTDAALIRAGNDEMPADPPADAETPTGPPLQPSQTGATSP